MNQNELIDLACEWLDAPTNGNIVLLRPVTLGNFELFVINARAPMLEQISVLKQRLAEVEKDYSILEQNYNQAELECNSARDNEKEALEVIAEQDKRIAELEQALRNMRNWIDTDTRAINRDVGVGNCSYNDIYESLDKLDDIAKNVLGESQNG